MQSRLRLAGQAVHPLLLMFPLGLFALVVIFDLAGLLGAPALIGSLAQCTLVAGLAGGTLALPVTWFDVVAVPDRPAPRPGVLVVLLDLGVLVLFAVIALLRLHHADRSAAPGLVGLEAAGLALGVSSAWFTGRLDGRPRLAAIRPG
jgi:uncharacterized membrane protein